MREEHLDLDELADLLAGEGTADDVEHVAHCDDCSAALADLDDALGDVDPLLEALLAAPVPELPAGFDARLAAELAGVVPEPAGDVGSGSVVGAVGLAPAGADDDRDTERDGARGASRDDDRDAGRDAGHGADDDADLAPVVPLRRPRGAGLLGVAAGGVALVLAGVLGLGLASSGGGSSSETAASGALPATGAEEQAGGSAADAATAGPLVLASGADYAPDAASVGALLPRLLVAEYSTTSRSAQQQPVSPAQAPAAEVAPAPAVATDLSAAGADPLARLREPDALQACLEAVAATAAGSAPEVPPVALDYASSEGQPALVVVQRAAPGLVEVTAVGPGCSADDPDRRWSLRLPG